MLTNAAAQTPPGRYAIKPLRWEEDYSTYQPPSDAGFPESWKRVSVGNGYVSFGGEARFRAEIYDEPAFGLRRIEDFNAAAGRLLFHAEWHPNTSVRGFTQLGVSDERGRKPRERVLDESALDFAQAFVDWTADGWRWRVGRQELAFGRYITTRDGTNLRRTFDGVRATGPLAGGTLDVFAAALTRQQKGAFDDDPDPKDRALAAAFTYPMDKRSRLIATYFGRHDARAAFASGSGDDTRHSLALRLQATRGPWDFDGQASVQFGDLQTPTRNLDIGAYGMATETGYTFPQMRWRPRLAIRLDAASGDDDPRDGKLGTFDLAYPNLTYISDAAAFAPRNLIGIQPFVTLKPTQGLTLTVGEDLLWRMYKGDALYAPPATVLAPAGGDGGLAAAQTHVRVNYAPNRFTEWSASLVQIHAGNAIKNAGGGSQLFAGGQISLKF